MFRATVSLYRPRPGVFHTVCKGHQIQPGLWQFLSWCWYLVSKIIEVPQELIEHDRPTERTMASNQKHWIKLFGHKYVNDKVWSLSLRKITSSKLLNFCCSRERILEPRKQIFVVLSGAGDSTGECEASDLETWKQWETECFQLLQLVWKNFCWKKNLLTFQQVLFLWKSSPPHESFSDGEEFSSWVILRCWVIIPWPLCGIFPRGFTHARVLSLRFPTNEIDLSRRAEDCFGLESLWSGLEIVGGIFSRN